MAKCVRWTRWSKRLAEKLAAGVRFWRALRGGTANDLPKAPQSLLGPSAYVALMVGAASVFLAVPMGAAASAVLPDRNAFGVVLAGIVSPGTAARQQLDRLAADWYYDYHPILDDEAPGSTKVAMVRGGEGNRADLAFVADQARKHPGHAWLIFNEPDVAGQDRVSDAFLAARGETRYQYYARVLRVYATTIKGADPAAKLVGPNLFNLQGKGLEWLQSLRAAYRLEYGLELPFDVIGVHLYSFDPTWKTLPQMDVTANQAFLTSVMSFASTLPTSPRVWVTETGSLWIYGDRSCSTVNGQLRCSGSKLDWPKLVSYTEAMIRMMSTSGVERWFFFSSNPAPDPWAAVPNATYLADETNQLTPIGAAWVRAVRASTGAASSGATLTAASAPSSTGTPTPFNPVGLKLTQPAAALWTSVNSHTVAGSADANMLVRVWPASGGAKKPGAAALGQQQLSGAATGFSITVPLAAGSNTFVVTETAASGAESAPVAVPTISLDATSPGGLTLTGPNVASGSSLWTYSAQDDPGAGLASLALRANGQTVDTCSITALSKQSCTSNLAGLAEGRHTVQAVATDRAGNQAVSSSISILVDRTPPTVSVTQPANGVVLAGSLPDLMATANDSGGSGLAGVRYETSSDGGKTWISRSSQVLANPPYLLAGGAWAGPAGLADGVYLVRAAAYDAVGNSTVSAAIAFRIQTPTIVPVSTAREEERSGEAGGGGGGNASGGGGGGAGDGGGGSGPGGGNPASQPTMSVPTSTPTAVPAPRVVSAMSVSATPSPTPTPSPVLPPAKSTPLVLPMPSPTPTSILLQASGIIDSAEGGMLTTPGGEMAVTVPSGASAGPLQLMLTTQQIDSSGERPLDSCAPSVCTFVVGNLLVRVSVLDADGNAVTAFDQPLVIALRSPFGDAELLGGDGEPSRMVVWAWSPHAGTWDEAVAMVDHKGEPAIMLAYLAGLELLPALLPDSQAAWDTAAASAGEETLTGLWTTETEVGSLIVAERAEDACELCSVQEYPYRTTGIVDLPL